jgi:hypothetical protein
MVKISRYSVEKFINCPRCCVLEVKYKIRQNTIPFTLNIAVDNLCKNEFDHYREKQEPHPLFLEHDIDAVPFKHPDIDDWRNNFRGIRYISEEHQYNFGGAIDDVWQKPNGQLIISDVKTTAKQEFDWDETYKYPYAKGYQRQLEMYQWLFKMNGYDVAPEAYIIYYNGKKNESSFDRKLEFDEHVIKLDCSTDWVEEKVIETAKTIQSDEFPKPSNTCETCNYLKKRWDLSQKINKDIT